MAIYHLTVKIVRRSKGQSAVACAAYRAAEVIRDESIGRTFYYNKKKGVVAKEILAPVGVPDWVFDRTKLWNVVETVECRKDSQLAREVEIAIPNELSHDEGAALVRQFVKEEFVAKGMIADVCFHRQDDDKPHAHIMLTMRDIGPEGFGRKVVDWNDRSNIWRWREAWARAANHHLARAGHEVRINHRSYKDLGIDLEPQPKLGVSSNDATPEYQKIIAERQQKFLDVTERNGERILKDPSIVAKAITAQRSTFTSHDIARFVATHTIDSFQFRVAYEKVLACDELVKLTKEKGTQRYTTREMVEVEQELIKTVDKLRVGSHSVDKELVLDAILTRAKQKKPLSRGQHDALVSITLGSSDIAVVEGYAGAGKSYMLDAAREVWERQGYRVKGAALAGVAAEGLQKSAKIESRSLHSWEYRWTNKEEDAPSSRDIFVIDEAGMVGSRQLVRILSKLQNAGAKVVLVGDTEQLQAVDAGAPMRAIASRVGKSTVSEIRRQESDWQKEATVKLANEKTKEAIVAYRDRGFVHEHVTQELAIDSVIAVWNEHRLSMPKESQILLAYRRDEVEKLNLKARELMRQSGQLGRNKSFLTASGEKSFAKGDRIYFLKNDSLLGVKNGTLGTIERVGKVGLQVRLDNGTQLFVDTNAYNHFDHGYAATVHKSQGVTVDRAHVLASTLFDRHVAYVAMSRHERQVDLHWSIEEFENSDNLFSKLSQKRQKDLVLDYAEVADFVSRLSRVDNAKSELDRKIVLLQKLRRDIINLSRSKDDIKFQLCKEIEKERQFCAVWRGKWAGTPDLQTRLDLSEVRAKKYRNKKFLMQEFLLRIDEQKQKRDVLVKRYDSLRKDIVLERAKQSLAKVQEVSQDNEFVLPRMEEKKGKVLSLREQGLVDDIVHAYYRSAGDEGQLVANLFVILMRETESYSPKSSIGRQRKQTWNVAQKALKPAIHENRDSVEKYEKLERSIVDVPKTLEEAKIVFEMNLRKKVESNPELVDSYSVQAVDKEFRKFWLDNKRFLDVTKAKMERLEPVVLKTLESERARFKRLRNVSRDLYSELQWTSELELIGEKDVFTDIPVLKKVSSQLRSAEGNLLDAQRNFDDPSLTDKSKRQIKKELKLADQQYKVAKEEFAKVYNSPDVKKQLRSLVNQRNEEITRAKKITKELKPIYQKSLDLGKSVERTRGVNKKRGKEWSIER